jgi:hypothetical protein
MVDNISDSKSVYFIKWDQDSLSGYTDDYGFVEYLRTTHKIFPEPIGTLKISRRQNKILSNPFVLNKFEVYYLIEKYLFFNF